MLIPAIWPRLLMPCASVCASPGKVPRSCMPLRSSHTNACSIAPSGVKLPPTACPRSLTANPTLKLLTPNRAPMSTIPVVAVHRNACSASGVASFTLSPTTWSFSLTANATAPPHGSLKPSEPRLRKPSFALQRNAMLKAHGLASRSEEHTSELQSHSDLVCRLLLEKKKQNSTREAVCVH